MTVYAPQMRFDSEWLQDMMQKNCLVISNGSTYYQGPCEAGVVFIPPAVMYLLTLHQGFDTKPFPYPNTYIVGDYPEDNGMEEMKEYLEKNIDGSLVLKWAAALKQIEESMKISQDLQKKAKLIWHNSVKGMIELDHKNKFRILPSIDGVSKSIINIQVRKDDRFMGQLELEKLHKAMQLDLSKEFLKQDQFLTNEQTIRQKFVIGKPVRYSYKGDSVLRLAIGFDETKQIVEKMKMDGNFEFSESDVMLFNKLSYLVDNFDSLDDILKMHS